MKATLAVALAAILTPSVALAQVAQQPVQRETTVVIPEREEAYTTTSVNTPLIMGGAVLFLGAYGGSVAYAANSEREAADRLYVPLVGPWLALNDWGDCPIEQPRCDENTTEKVLLVAVGVFQADGVITMLTGLLPPREHTEGLTRTADTTKTRLTPTRNGFAVVGKF